MIVRQFGAESAGGRRRPGRERLKRAYNDLVSSDPSKCFDARQCKNEDNELERALREPRAPTGRRRPARATLCTARHRRRPFGHRQDSI